MGAAARTPARTAADDLVRADIFVDGDRLGFVHPIVRAALYQDLVPGECWGEPCVGGRRAGSAGRLAERVSAHLLLTSPDRGPG